MSPHFPFPADPARLQPEAMSAMLGPRWPGVDVRDVQVVERARCGDGIASTADRVTLALTYGPGADAGLPSRMMLKTILLPPWLRFGLPTILGLRRGLDWADGLPGLGPRMRPLTFGLINVYQRFFPHAPEAMYLNEVRFYRDVRPELGIEAPLPFASAYDPGSRRFAVLMEDLRLRQARFPNATTDNSLPQVQALVQTLARLHATHWDSPRLRGDLAWLPTTRSGGMFPVFDAIGLDIIEDQVRRNPFKQHLLAPLNRSLRELWDANWRAQALLADEPPTVLHGDTHIANTYLLPDDSGGLLDWQLMVRGAWSHDLTYLLATSMPPAMRRQHERELIGLYLDRLGHHGVGTPPAPEHAWLRYRQSAIWGLVIGWLITPPQNYGPAITEANIARTVTAIQDLESLAAVE